MPTPTDTDRASEEQPQTLTDDRYTDLGNAQRLVKRHGDRLRYVKEWGWLVWDGKRWKRDDTDAVMRFAKQTVRALYVEAAEIEENARRFALLEHARRSEGLYRLEAMVKLARSEPEVVASVHDFDTDDWLFNVQNGTINLRMGELTPHNPHQLITKLADVDYDPNASSKLWERFLEDITGERPDLKAYLQRAVGYSLTGVTREEVLFIPHGSGRNGKSKFLEAIKGVMGDYAANTQPRTLLRKEGGSSVSNDVAALTGARLVTAIETESGKELDVSTVKQWTGGDAVTARFLYGEFFTFKPKFKLWLATNNQPGVNEQTVAIWARLKLIPFTVSFAGREDKELEQKLEAARPAILTWAVRGCLLWQRDGLQEPEEVTAATEDYRSAQDTLQEFFDEKCEIGGEQEVKARDLYNAYKGWCDETRQRPLTETEFGSQVVQHGYQRKRDKQGRRYVGIGLADPRRNFTALPARMTYHEEVAVNSIEDLPF